MVVQLSTLREYIEFIKPIPLLIPSIEGIFFALIKININNKLKQK
jgi:hypothetical protein